MENINIELFEGQELKVMTDKGNVLYNLVETAKILGITKNNKGKLVVNWKSGNSNLISKIKSIYSSGTDGSTQYIEEIEYILDEIDNCENRNNIYISSWLGKRLAMECKNSKAMKYKNYLATLDEKYSKGELTSNISTEELGNLVSSTVNSILPTLINEMTNKLIPTVLEAKNSVSNMQNLMHDQATIYDTERNELKSMIGMRSKNVKQLTDKLKYELERHYGEPISAKDTFYINAKNKLFSQLRIQRWEQLPVDKYNKVFADIEVLFEE